MGALGLGERLAHGGKRSGKPPGAPVEQSLAPPGSSGRGASPAEAAEPSRAASLATAPHAKPMAASFFCPRGQAGELLPSRISRLSSPRLAPAGREFNSKRCRDWRDRVASCAVVPRMSHVHNSPKGVTRAYAPLLEKISPLTNTVLFSSFG